MYELPNSNTIIISLPIAIPTKSKLEQYSLLHTRFDPPQNSPPSLWKMRLNKRVGVLPPNDKKNGISSNLKDAAPFVVGGRNPLQKPSV
jgi:hypothetical protein